MDARTQGKQLITSSSSDYTKTKTIQVSVIIPVYNQQRNIPISLSRIRNVLNSTMLEYEIIVVDDGSIDDTLQILKKEEEKDPRIRAISYFPNKGKGFAVKTGVIESFGNLVMFTDGDLDISPDAIMDYIKELEKSDLVIASKKHHLSIVNAPVSRKFLSRAFNVIVRIGTGIRIGDTQSGLKAGKGDVLRTIFGVMLVKRYAFDVELLTIASMLNLSIKELPIIINLDRRFKVKDIGKMLIDVTAISYRYRIARWYQKQLQAIN